MRELWRRRYPLDFVLYCQLAAGASWVMRGGIQSEVISRGLGIALVCMLCGAVVQQRTASRGSGVGLAVVGTSVFLVNTLDDAVHVADVVRPLLGAVLGVLLPVALFLRAAWGAEDSSAGE